VAPDPLFERLQRALSPDYRLERELASGGMGIVYVAHEIALDRAVAVKVIRPELDTAHAAEAFMREARILANVPHPNIVSIHKPGEGQDKANVVGLAFGNTNSPTRLRVFAGQRELLAIARRVAGTLFQPKVVLQG